MNLELQVFLQHERESHHGEDDASWHIRAKIAKRPERSLNGLDQVTFAMIRTKPSTRADRTSQAEEGIYSVERITAIHQ